MIDELFKKLEELKKTKLNSKNKEYLLKLLQLYEHIKEKKIIDEIIDEMKKMEISSEELFFIEIRINSILEESKKKEYKEKIDNNLMVIYKYSDKTILYIKDENKIDEIMTFISKLEYKFIHLYKNNQWIKKKEINKIEIQDLKDINKIVNSRL